MSLPDSLEAALRRLNTAIDLLEAAAERRRQGGLARGDSAEELAIMQDDRARLAAELDGALARGRSLDLAHGEVARRIERARAHVVALIEAAEPPAAETPPQEG